MPALSTPDTIAGPLQASDLDRETNPGNVWLMPRRASAAQCPPCTGRCRQGRDCPGPATISTDYGTPGWLDSCAPEGGRHADPVSSGLVSMQRHRRVRRLVGLALLFAVAGAISRALWPLAGA